ncbi:MAG: helix-turn-helix transcriptional regulator [Tissierellia bacterium]|nr:helix-turn-helix transcriptional regulator [Tissierellia bacterium]
MRKDNYEWQLFVLMLKEIATEKGITQEIIAQRSGLIQSNVSRIFALKYKPTLDTFLQVAKAVGVNFYFEDKESNADLNTCFERAMESLGRRPDKLNKN